MKKVTVFLAAFVLLALMVVPVFAYGSVSGSVIDSVESDPWAYGGEVWVFNTVTGAICGTSTLAVDGTFSVTLNGTQNDLGAVGVATCMGVSDTIEILIDFDCGTGTATCNAPYANPGTNSVQFGQNAIPVNYNAGYIETNTGPTAVTLQNVSANSNSTTALGIGFVVLMLAGVTFVMFRRRETA